MTVFMAVTGDRFELPLCVANNATEMARYTGSSRSDVYRIIRRNSKTRQGYRILKIDIDDDETQKESAYGM